MVFAPHPDDETLGCGGTIARRIEEGYGVKIVVMTDGRYAFSKILGIESDPTPEELKLIRRNECIEATKVLGVPTEDLEFFEFEDGSLLEKEREAKGRIEEILRIRPLEIYIPDYREHSPDHQATNRMVHNAIRNMSVETSAYEYSIMPFSPRLLALRRLIPLRTVHMNIERFFSLKEAAIKKYPSQISLISAQQNRPVLSASEVHKCLGNSEVFFVKHYRPR